MPNWVRQVLYAKGEGARDALQSCWTDFDEVDDITGKREQWSGFDFGKLIARPAIIDEIVENGAERYIPFIMKLDGCHVLWQQLRELPFVQAKGGLPPWQGFVSLRDDWMLRHLAPIVRADVLDNARKMIRAFAETGHKGWFDWSVANWGTKWNAVRSRIEHCEGGAALRMDTAWSVPLPVLERFAARFPGLTMTYYAFDEGWNFCATGGGVGGSFGVDHFKPQRSSEHSLQVYRECYERDPEPDEVDEETDPLAANTMH